MIIADRISKSFGEKQVLDDISFVVRPGEITGLIGLNGSGKTTLLSIIAGIIKEDSGYLRVASKEPIQTTIGFINSRHSNILEGGTVKDSFELCRRMYHVPLNYYTYVLNYAGQKLNIQRFWAKNKNELTLGESSKANFLYTLFMRPTLWLMDEPTVGVDYESRLQIYELIKHFKNLDSMKNTTILIATHNMQEMELLCEKVLVIHDGRSIFRGKLEQLQEKYKSWGRIHFEVTNGSIHLQDMPIKQYKIQGNEVQILYDKRYVNVTVILKQLYETADLKKISIEDIDMETMIKSVFQ